MKTKTAARCQSLRSIVGKTPKHYAPPSAPKLGFTLVELLAVIAVIALLAAVRVPALCRVNVKSQALTCTSNQRQLTAAWISWSQDNGDNLLDSRSWVGGDVSDPSSLDFLDFNKYLSTGSLAPYVGGNVKVYKCPADTRVSTIPGAAGRPVCRSVSMNGYILNSITSGFFAYIKTSDLRRPGPASTFVFLDESPQSINDGFFSVPMDTYDPSNPNAASFIGVPAAFHGAGGSFSFADGHTEIHQWTDSRTPTTPIFGSSPNNQDLDWLQSKSSAKITNPTR